MSPNRLFCNALQSLQSLQQALSGISARHALFLGLPCRLAPGLNSTASSCRRIILLANKALSEKATRQRTLVLSRLAWRETGRNSARGGNCKCIFGLLGRKVKKSNLTRSYGIQFIFSREMEEFFFELHILSKSRAARVDFKGGLFALPFA